MWAFGFFYAQLYTCAIYAGTGVSFAWWGHYFLLHLGFFLFTLFVIWKYRNPWVKLASLPIFVLLGYISFRYLQPYYLILNPVQMIWNIIITAAGAINILYILISIVFELYSAFKSRRDEIFKINFRVYEKVALLILVILVPLIFWSYVGFSQTYEVVDPEQEEFSVSFWGTPSVGFNVDAYNDTLVQQELELYKKLNTTFIFGMSHRTFESNTTKYNYGTALKYLETFGIKFMVDTSISFPWYNETSGKWVWKGDFVTYYYCEQVNLTIDGIMNWVEEYNLTNFRGITLDLEYPKYTNSSYVVSKEAFEAGLFSFSEKFKEFRARFPGKQINGISTETVIYDMIDGDHDLQIAQYTVDHAMDIDMHGYMTYHTGFSTPSTSSYYYTTYMMQGKKAHGIDFQPWVGWWYDPKDENDTNVIGTPFVYEQTIEQFKIAKSFGVREVVLAPLRNYLSKNLTAGVERLQALVDIKENGFEKFTIPIVHDMRFFNAFSEWTIHPNVWLANPAIFEDMMMGTPFQGFLISDILISIGGALLIFYLLKRFDRSITE